MHLNEKLDYIIVGQGIAGSVLAFKLITSGKKIAVFDQPDKNRSSAIAGGIFNPITGKNMIKTWKADVLWPTMLNFYKDVEKTLRVKILHQLDHYRPFLTPGESNDFIAKSSMEGYMDFIKDIHTTSTFGDVVYDPYGGISLAQTGYIDVPLFLQSVSAFLKKAGSYYNEFLHTEDLITTGPVTYKGLTADKIIFCTGPDKTGGQYFPWLPYKPVKGEVIKVEFTRPVTQIFNRGVFILPLHDGTCTVGATYDHSELSMERTERARERLIQGLKKLTSVHFNVTNQRAGIRPATIDRRPFIGIHPENPHLALFNGLGAKGVSLAPYMAEELISQLNDPAKIIQNEVSIRRYYHT